MTRKPWGVHPPDLDDAPRAEPPALDPLEPAWRGVWVRGHRLVAAEPVEQLELDDVRLEDCDLAGLTVDNGRARRLHLAGGRVRGLTWARGLLDDVFVDGVTGADISLRFSTLRRTVVRDAVLPGLDLTETVFDRVRFERCDLRGARFDHGRVVDLRIEGCNLAGATGVDALRGASVHPDDAATMTVSLARALGLTVEED